MWGTARVIDTIRFDVNAGRRCRRITYAGRAPMSTAAVEKSSSRTARSLLRTLRASAVHSMTPRITVMPT